MSNDEPEGIPFRSTDLKSDSHLPIQKIVLIASMNAFY